MEVVIADDLGMMTFAGAIFHMPDITFGDDTRPAITGCDSRSTCHTDQLLPHGRRVDRFVPARAKAQENQLTGGFRLRNLNALRGRGKDALLKNDFHVSPVGLAVLVGIELVVLHDLKRRPSPPTRQ